MKAYPIVEEMIQSEITREDWENDIRMPNRLVQYFQSIHTLAQAGSCIDGKNEVVSMKGLWDLSQESNRLKGLQGELCMYTHKYRLDKIREDLSILQPYNYNHVQVPTTSSACGEHGTERRTPD